MAGVRCSDLKPGNVLMATRATYANDTRGFICKARTVLGGLEPASPYAVYSLQRVSISEL